jgi:type IV secretion system protein VirB1
VIGPAALAALLSSCAPSVSSDTMSAIISVESGGNPYAVGDNTDRRSYSPRTYAEGLALAQSLLARGHNIDLGLAQVNSSNFLAYRVTAASVLFPCQNLIVASAILAGAYSTSSAVFHSPETALRGALGAYNTGSVYSGAAYVSRVVSAAAVPSIAILSGQPSPAPSARPTAAPKPRPKATPGPWHGEWPAIK